MPEFPRCTRCNVVVSPGQKQCYECKRLTEFGVQGQHKQFGDTGDTQESQSYPSGPPKGKK